MGSDRIRKRLSILENMTVEAIDKAEAYILLMVATEHGCEPEDMATDQKIRILAAYWQSYANGLREQERRAKRLRVVPERVASLENASIEVEPAPPIEGAHASHRAVWSRVPKTGRYRYCAACGYVEGSAELERTCAPRKGTAHSLPGDGT